MSDFRNMTLSYIKFKPTTDESVEFGEPGSSGPSFYNRRYGSAFDNLEVGVFYQKNYEKIIDGVKHHECQVVISRNKLTLVDGAEVMVEQHVYRGYFDVVDNNGHLDYVDHKQRQVIKNALAIPGIAMYHGYVDRLDKAYCDYNTFQDLRESAGAYLFMDEMVPAVDCGRSVFSEGKLKFDSADVEGEQCVVTVETICAIVSGSTNDKTGYIQDIVFTAKHKEHDCVLKLHKFSMYPFLDIVKIYEENNKLINATLRIK